MTIAQEHATHLIAIHPKPWANNRIHLRGPTSPIPALEAWHSSNASPPNLLSQTRILDIVGPMEKGAIVILAQAFTSVSTVRYFVNLQGEAPFHCTLSPSKLVMFAEFVESEEGGPIAPTGPVPAGTQRVVVHIAFDAEDEEMGTASVDPFDLPDSVSSLVVVLSPRGVQTAVPKASRPLGPLANMFHTFGESIPRLEMTFVGLDDVHPHILGFDSDLKESIATQLNELTSARAGSDESLRLNFLTKEAYRTAVGDMDFAIDTVSLSDTALRRRYSKDERDGSHSDTAQ